ncbi:MAG: DUF2007 domain-containing protein [Candidatus Stygibacter frigidus]|nr:DUF2007 domain-containing protein [Candidatus Stygibacter frigidus]
MNEDYVTVLKTYNLGTIAIAKSLLSDAGIDFTVKNENFGSIYNGFYTVSGFIEIQVRNPDAETALETLEELQKDSDEPGEKPAE